MNELCTKGAMELAAMIASGKTTSAEVVDAHLARIEEVNPHLNAVTVTMADAARAAAAAVDEAAAAGAPLGPLAGVPFTVKENIDVAGSATTWGVAALAEQIASADAPMVARLRESGAIPIARTNLPDFAFRWHTASGRAGHTRNPWDPSRTPGGSSGGEAAALASGMTPLGLGNDLGGSLRLPSQMCGTTALRPSRGRVADGAVTEPSASPMAMAIQMTNCQGPMARRVADLRAGPRPLLARSSGSLSEPLVALAERLPTAVLEHGAVGHRDAVEVPGENAVERCPRSGAVANQNPLEERRAEALVGTEQPKAEARERGTLLADMEGDIGHDQRARGRVEEVDLVRDRKALEERLLELAAPCLRSLLAEDGAPRDVRTLLLEAGGAIELDIGPCLAVLAREQVVHLVRRDDESDTAELVELRAEPGIRRNRGVQEELAAREPYHGHAGADLQATEAQRSLGHPQFGGERSQHWATISRIVDETTCTRWRVTAASGSPDPRTGRAPVDWQ